MNTLYYSFPKLKKCKSFEKLFSNDDMYNNSKKIYMDEHVFNLIRQLHNFKIQSVQSKCSILIATSSRVYNYLDNNNNKLISKNKKEIEKIILEYNSNKKNLKFNSPGHFIHNIDLNYEKIQKDEFRIGIFFRGKNDLITMNKI
jgi:hypothetical protein